MAESLFFFPYQMVTPSVGRQKWSFLCLTYCVSYTNKLYDFHFSKFIHFWCYFTPLLNFPDTIVPCLFRRQLFTHSLTLPTQPSNFHETISSNVSPNLQPANFLSTLYLLPTDGVTVWSSTCKSGSGNTILFTSDRHDQNLFPRGIISR